MIEDVMVVCNIVYQTFSVNLQRTLCQIVAHKSINVSIVLKGKVNNFI